MLLLPYWQFTNSSEVAAELQIMPTMPPFTAHAGLCPLHCSTTQQRDPHHVPTVVLKGVLSHVDQVVGQGEERVLDGDAQ